MKHDHQMGWPTNNQGYKGEIKLELKYLMTDASKGTPYDEGYNAQRLGGSLNSGRALFPNDKDRAKQWTMGWGAAYAEHGPAIKRFADGGIVERVNNGRYGEFPGGPVGYFKGMTGPRGTEHMGAEAIMPLIRDPSGPFCVIAKYPGRNFFKDMTGAVKHADKLLGRNNQGASELLITSVARVVSREPEPKPPLRVRNPRPGEFA